VCVCVCGWPLSRVHDNVLDACTELALKGHLDRETTFDSGNLSAVRGSPFFGAHAATAAVDANVAALAPLIKSSACRDNAHLPLVRAPRS
jgi:hypothetical protein